MTSDCADSTWLDSVMVPEDLSGVLTIERLSFPSTWSRESYLRELRSRNSYYFVARLADAIIGHAGMWTISDEAHISTIAVLPKYRGRGLGRRLLSHLIQLARHHHAAQVTLEVREANHIARSLYRTFDFAETGVLPRYYGDTGETGIIMCKLLSPPT